MIVCAWRACGATCDALERPLPLGWLWLATWHDNKTPGRLDFLVDEVVRDAALCPEHVAALEALLIPIHFPPPEGQRH